MEFSGEATVLGVWRADVVENHIVRAQIFRLDQLELLDELFVRLLIVSNLSRKTSRNDDDPRIGLISRLLTVDYVACAEQAVILVHTFQFVEAKNCVLDLWFNLRVILSDVLLGIFI